MLTKLPDAELEIMQTVWKVGAESSSAEIIQNLPAEREWATTTVLTLLARLVERGFLSVRRIGKSNIYAPLVSENTYLENASKTFLEKLHGNSLKSLVAALFDGNAISESDIAELKDYINERAGDDHDF
ncbi:MAG: BlaI/MecI/CopY family transcriptional regulator [Defluviitaleaceae bacterium]|nr:BlaI/MecI/CopY family transcriptional regulator [Defluviitaleaceae bacterium]